MSSSRASAASLSRFWFYSSPFSVSDSPSLHSAGNTGDEDALFVEMIFSSRQGYPIPDASKNRVDVYSSFQTITRRKYKFVKRNS